MKLEEIGFYTLSDDRARNSSIRSPLWRCELILTDRCNFNCPYCRGVRPEFSGDIDFEIAKRTVDLWCKDGLKNIRFSGGEPTLYSGLDLLVKRARAGGVERIALSTNGSAPRDYYEYLVSCGVNDFSISLDACCSSTCSVMSGIVDNDHLWDDVVRNIEYLSTKVYTTVGVVLTETNINEVIDIVKLSDRIGVSDIRLISAAQSTDVLKGLDSIGYDILGRYPILNYRVKNYNQGIPVRGLSKNDCSACFLMMDDMAVMQGYHFPCIIHLREGGDPVGEVNERMRWDRLIWIASHDSTKDPICSHNCLDVCKDYNNKCKMLQNE